MSLSSNVTGCQADQEEDTVVGEEESAQVEETKEDVQLSKRAQKKLAKRQQWLDSKQERRAKEREKRKARMATRRAETDYQQTRTESRKSLKRAKMTDSDCKVSVVFDMQFGDLMHDRDLGKCLKQIARCYSYNRRLAAPLQLYMTSHCGAVEAALGRNDGYRNWDLHFSSEHYSQQFSKENLVYLTAESEEVLEKLDEDKVYVIGGLVDHNHHKGLCHEKATELGIPTARLPIDEFIALKTRKVGR